jgi:uncharacterized protein YifE (UPF0438 family)
MNTRQLPDDHLVYLQQRPFRFGCETSIFPMDELHALSECGNWLEALAAGAIEPVNDEQRHFVAVAREEAEPVNICERAWFRLKGRREYEREESPPSQPAEDYGIIEWDADRCWW